MSQIETARGPWGEEGSVYTERTRNPDMRDSITERAAWRTSVRI